jgi:hypothetical protein
MKQVKTARGRTIDMGALVTKNEKIKAVGNVLMNARGDRLNPDGSIRLTVEQMAKLDQDRKTPPVTTPISDPKPITSKEEIKNMFDKSAAPDIPLDPEPISKITRTRDDGTKYVEIEYDDGSIETIELKEN